MKHASRDAGRMPTTPPTETPVAPTDGIPGVDEYLAIVSHELRTPLTAILGWVHMLRSQDLALERREYALAVIERNARAQAQLIADLLDVSRLVSGRIELQLHPVSLRDVVTGAIEAVRTTAQSRSVELQLDLPEAVPVVRGDAVRLAQVATSLLSNAVKFTPKGGHVRISLRVQTLAVLLRVEDTGQGIRPDFLPHVFEPFRQGDPSLTRAHGGLGVGLAITRHLVQLHGGTIRARSAGVGRGSLFEVRLPRAAPRTKSKRAADPRRSRR